MHKMLKKYIHDEDPENDPVKQKVLKEDICHEKIEINVEENICEDIQNSKLLLKRPIL